MKESIYRAILFSLIALCLILTMAHFAYAVYAYEHGSIIEFIGKELWG